MPAIKHFHDIIIEEQHENHGSNFSLLEVCNGVIYVKPFNLPIWHVRATQRFALDENPLNPDSLMLKSYTTNNSVPLRIGRSSIWTLLPVLCGDGTVIFSLLLQRCQSLPVDAAKFTSTNNACVAATENSRQCDNSWLQFAEICLPQWDTSFSQTGFGIGGRPFLTRYACFY